MNRNRGGYQPRDATPAVVVFEGNNAPPGPSAPSAPQAPRAPVAPPPLPTAPSAPKSELRSSVDSWSDNRDQVAPLPGQNVGYGMPPPGMPQQGMPPQQGMAGRRQMMTYGRREPLRREISFVALCFCFAYFVSLCYYVFVRLTRTIEWEKHPVCAC
jgi:hypothetical protein